MAAASQNIVVWEWQDDYVNYNLFIAYEPNISNKIEEVYARGLPQPAFVISVDVPAAPKPIHYSINLNDLDQTNSRTGLKRTIRRRTVPATTALATRHTWQWQESGKSGKKFWLSYATEIVEQIESAYLQESGSFTFPAKYSMPYKVDFTTMLQTNMNSGFHRKIQRIKLKQRYKIDQLSPPSTPSKSTTPIAANAIPPVMPQSYNYGHNRVSSQQPQMNPTAQNNGGTYQGGLYPQLYPSLTSSPATLSAMATTSHAVASSSHAVAATSQAVASYSNTVASSSQAVASSSQAVAATSQAVAATASSQSGSAMKKWRRRHVPWNPCPSGGISCSVGGPAAKVPVSQVISSYTNKVQIAPNSTDQCSICQSDLTDESGFGNNNDTVELTLCKHVYHLECIEASYSHGVQNGCIVCPSCNKSHGVITGNQPPGVMKYSSSSSSLPGYPGHGTIKVEYHIAPGRQSSEHPHPGQSFGTPAFPRIGYLPDNDEGRSILYLLVEAWKRRLIFTVGRSSTTGMDNVVTWTGIHHKTSQSSHGGHGYPDPTYLERVRDELETVGVVEKC